MADYLPRGDRDLEVWARSFDHNIAADPAAFGLDLGESQKIHQMVEAYAAALALAQAPATRTVVQIHAKDQARADLVGLLRQYGRRIKADASVDGSRKLSLGLTVNGNGTTARAIRETGGVGAGIGSSPMLTVLLATPRRHKLICLDAAGGESRAKPAGTVGLQVFCQVGDTPPSDPLQCPFLRLVTRQPFVVDFHVQQVRQTAYYFARWQNAKGQTGPWSQVVSMTVAG